MLQHSVQLTEYQSSINYYSDEWTHDWATGVSSTTSLDPCNTPNPPWWCEETEPVPIDPNILMIVGMFLFGIALLAQSVRASDS